MHYPILPPIVYIIYMSFARLVYTFPNDQHGMCAYIHVYINYIYLPYYILDTPWYTYLHNQSNCAIIVRTVISVFCVWVMLTSIVFPSTVVELMFLDIFIALRIRYVFVFVM